MCVLEQIKTVYNVRPKDENDNRILPLLSLRTLLENVDLISGKYAVELYVYDFSVLQMKCNYSHYIVSVPNDLKTSMLFQNFQHILKY